MKLLLLAVFLCGAPEVRAQSLVNLCPLDTQPGAGVNFAAAMRAGGNITFGPACGTIHVTQTYLVSVSTTIMGDNRVTLDTTVPLGTNGMFSITGTAELGLQQITLKPAMAFAVVMGQSADKSRVTLYQTHIVGPAMSGVAVVGTVSSVGGSFANITGVALSGGNVDVEGSECDNCGLGVQSTLTASITGSTFSGGSSAVQCESGSLDISGSHFLNYTAGAIRTWCATTIGSSDFHNNHADTGGAVSVNPLEPGVSPQNPGSQSASLSITGTTFAGNRATGAGGAVSVQIFGPVAPQVMLHHVVFDSNAADQGGGLDLGGLVGRGAALNASAVLFTKNTAVHDGGGFHGMNVSGQIARGIFTNNKAAARAGAPGWSRHRRSSSRS